LIEKFLSSTVANKIIFNLAYCGIICKLNINDLEVKNQKEMQWNIFFIKWLQIQTNIVLVHFGTNVLNIRTKR